jgi:hypothetical protein
MCQECQKPALGSVYCEVHLPAAAAAPQPPPLPGFAGSPYAARSESPYSAPAGAPYAAASPYNAPAPSGPVPDYSVHPTLALILGFFPGVGAIYNGQYAKGLIHAVVFGLLVSLESNAHTAGMASFLGIMIAIWVVYQAFESHHTARKRRYGLAVEEFSSLFEVRQANGRFPASAILLIGVGFLLLLDTTDIINMEQVERFWPLLLIVAGVYMLYARLNPSSNAGPHASDGGVR